jgi:hypothetical protein
MKKSDKKIKRKIGAIAVLGIFLAIALSISVTADYDTLAWFRDDTNNDVTLSSSASGYDVGINDDDPDFKLEVAGSSGDGYFGVSSAAGNDGDVFIIDSSGNVGIGTTSPNQKLEVLATSTQLRLAYDNSNYAEFQVASTGVLTIRSTDDIDIHTSSIGSVIYMDDSTKAVGMGTTVPGSKLEIISGGAAGASSALHVKNRDSTSLLFVRDDGNIGMGVTNPAEKLEISGNILFNFGSARSISVETCPTPNAAGNQLTVGAGNAVGGGVGGYDGGNLYLRSGDGAGTGIGGGDGGDVYIYGGAKAQFTGRVDGDVILAHDGSTALGNVGIGTADPNTAKLAVIGGNVGIGTTGPNDELEVVGDASADRFVARTGAGDVEFADEDGTDGMKIDNSDINPNILIGDYSVTPQNFRGIYLDGALQTTSIGTVDSSSRLVVASIDDEDDAIRLLGPDGGTTAWGARLNFGDDEDAYIEEDENDKLYIYADSRIALMGSFVGIGQTIPLAKLEVLEATGNPQLRLTYENQVKFVDFEVESDSDLLIKTSLSG